MKATLRVILSVALAVPFAAFAACDETVPVTPAPPAADAGPEAAAPGLFQRLGGEAGIAKFIDAVVAAEVADPEIASYFAPNSVATPAAGKPTVTQIKECLVKQISAAAGGKDSAGAAIPYPTTVSGGYKCRDMVSSHAALHIGSGTFDKFATIAVTVAKGAGIAESDLAIVSTFLNGQKADVVDESAPANGFYDAGSTPPTDSGGTPDAPAPTDAAADVDGD